MEIPHFEGVNSLVASHVGKKVELQYAENARSDEIGSVEKRRGTILLGNDQSTASQNYAFMYFENEGSNHSGLFKVTKTTVGTYLFYLNSSTENWTNVTTVDDSIKDWTIAEGNMFITNQYNGDRPFYIENDGATKVESNNTAITNHLYGAPKAGKINYYKDRLYMGDYMMPNGDSVRIKNGIAVSSLPLGVVGFVTEDYASGVTTIAVSDTTFIRGDGTDKLDVYRGNTKIGTLTVTGKTETEITCNATSFVIESADELWVEDTHGDAQKIFRWPDVFGGKNQQEQKEYDSFKLSGEQNGPITMMANVGDVMVYANNQNMGIWNNLYPKSLDLGIGCCSPNGYAKALGTLWFIDYSGVYSTNGGFPRLMSAKVEKYILGARKSYVENGVNRGLDHACMGRKRFSIFASIGHVDLYHEDGSLRKTLRDVVLEYNLRQENWYVHTNIDAMQFVTYFEDDDVELLAFNAAGTSHAYMNTLEFLNKEAYVDDVGYEEREIPFRIDTNKITLSNQFEKINYPQEVILETTRGSSLQTFVALDRNKFYRITGDNNKGCTVLKVSRRNHQLETEPRCRQITLSIRDFTKKPCKISRMAIIYMMTSEEENQDG